MAATLLALPTRFPPTFDDNPLSYCLALFSLTLITSISLGIVIGWVLEARRSCRIDMLVHNPIPRPLRRPRQPGMISAVTLYRLIVSMLLLTIIARTLPGMLILFAWGEASDESMHVLFGFDRLLAGLALAPFLVGVFVALRAAQPVEHQLGLDPVLIRMQPSWRVVREKMPIVLLVLLIAVGVTFYKAYPG